MTQEERQLLLQDLSARLPYGLLVKTPDHYSPQVVNSVSDNLEVVVQKNLGYSLLYEVKPYLRPMSSMSDEEFDELSSLGSGVVVRKDVLRNLVLDVWYNTSAIDWLNERHFDYRGLIPMGLALEAPDGMYLAERKEK